MSGNDFHGAPPEDGDEGYDEAYDAHRAALWDMLMAYADEHDLADGFLSDLVSDLGLSLRMVAYAAETEKPSVGGLRLDLDRYAREMGESVREAKKGAATFIAEAKAARESEEAEAPLEDSEPAAAEAPSGNGEEQAAATSEADAPLAGSRSFPRRQ